MNPKGYIDLQSYNSKSVLRQIDHFQRALNRKCVLILLVFFMATSALHIQAEDDVNASTTPSSIAWSWFKALDGKYGTMAPDGADSTVSYNLISNDTALMEVWGTPATRVELTVFYMDGDDLVATHYCAGGTQATFVANANIGQKRVEFSMRSITNLRTPDDAHVHRFAYQFQDESNFERTETWRKEGKDMTYPLTIRKP